MGTILLQELLSLAQMQLVFISILFGNHACFRSSELFKQASTGFCAGQRHKCEYTCSPPVLPKAHLSTFTPSLRCGQDAKRHWLGCLAMNLSCPVLLAPTSAVCAKNVVVWRNTMAESTPRDPARLLITALTYFSWP